MCDECKLNPKNFEGSCAIGSIQIAEDMDLSRADLLLTLAATLGSFGF